ncbi:beta-lactamase family protein [Terrimonas sp. NA20]|uniref:Beta-lactamase family protein n=1 Tax=Terrimonas ginsenosidimutans TaxID=2908004 RepID=A0ABS9KZK0_9BACT|nr:serine hydrolase domain-containing protein [Terrimonas ginsenosidimutans]MCG2617772.1 beta-lactamase family protein [Terrimonas ginsenosidimutans]
MNRYLSSSLVLLSIFLCVNAGAQNKKARIDSLLKHSAHLGILNGNVLIVEQGKTLYQGSFGFADAARKVRLTPQHRFHIGSIAKEFNAVAIMMLEEQGRLSLDDKLSVFISGLPRWADSIEVINLLQYTSGLPDLKWNTVTSDGQAMEMFRQIAKLDFVPGSQYAYNNSNTYFQRRIIEKLTKTSFNNYVKNALLKPTGMYSSVIDPLETEPLMAKSFSREGVQDPLTYPQSGWTAVTLDDFYKWSQAINSFRLLTPASTQVLLIPFAPNKQTGLGGGAMKDRKIQTHVHDGSARNYQALLDVDATKGRTIIWMTNSRNAQMFAVTEAIKQILNGEPYKLPKKSVFELMQKKADSLSGAALIKYYNDLKSTLAADYTFDSEAELNMLGYQLMNKGRLDDAIAVFTYNTKLFPSSGNVFDSAGEAFYNKGDWKQSFNYYTRSVILDSTNQGAREKVIELRKKINANVH